MLAIALHLLLATPAPLAAGQVAEKLACASDPALHYDLYLPTRFTPQQRWPILYVFDPRGRARLALDLFKGAAEERGFVVASSHDTQSDTNDAPNERALKCMWLDTRERLPIAPGRAYAAGFSGGARLATVLGANSHGEVSGVFLAGGGFADSRRLPAGMTFAVFGTAGRADFNYLEVRRLPAFVASSGAPVRVEEFDGPHAWPPAELAREGLLWFDLQAQKAGRAPRDGVAGELLARWRARAAEKEAAGDLLGALETWEAAVRDLEGVADVSEGQAAVARLQGREEVAKERRRREKADRDEVAYHRVVLDSYGALLNLGAPAPLKAELLRRLDVDGLRARARKAETVYERQSAQRRLEQAFVQASFYVPRMLLARGESARAALAHAVAVEIRPGSPVLHYNLACAWALAGRKKEALAELRRAVELGYKDAAHMAADPDLASLRGEQDFEKMLANMR
jgi:predicted esterase